MTHTRISVELSIAGAPALVRFDDAQSYSKFKDKVNQGGSSLTLLTGQDNDRIWVRPSSVDAISEGAST